LLSLRLQPANRSNLILFSHALLKAVNRLHRQKTPCSANLDSSDLIFFPFPPNNGTSSSVDR
jgi:hypothetical protein